MALPKLKMEVRNSRAIAGGADFPKDIATLYLLVRLDVGPVQMAVASPPRCLFEGVLDHYAVSTNPVLEDSYNCPVCRSDDRRAHSRGEVDPALRAWAAPPPGATPIAVVRQNPSGALCRASSKSDGGDERESPCDRFFARVVTGDAALVRHPHCNPTDA